MDENNTPEPATEPADLSLSQREPLLIRAAITTAVTAVVHVAVVLGAPLDQAAELAIGSAVDAVGLVVLLILARASVTANAKVIARVTNAGQVVAGDAAVTPTGTELGVVMPERAGTPVLQPVGVKPQLATDTLPH